MQHEEENRLDDKARIEIMQVVNEFKNRPREEWTTENIQEFCEKEKIDRAITPGFLSDYSYQVKMDEIMVTIFPEIMGLIQEKISWTPLFALQASHDESNEAVKQVQADIVKLLERENVEVDYAQSMIQNISRTLETLFTNVGSITKNRTQKVYAALARKEFDAPLMTMGHVGKYSAENFEAEK